MVRWSADHKGEIALAAFRALTRHDGRAQHPRKHNFRILLGSALPGVLKKALDVVRNEKRQALVNIICKKP